LLAAISFLDSTLPEPKQHFGVNLDEQKEVADPWLAKGT
jgi:hypothetical protein